MVSAFYILRPTICWVHLQTMHQSYRNYKTYKGFMFILITSILLYTPVKQTWNRASASYRQINAQQQANQQRLPLQDEIQLRLTTAPWDFWSGESAVLP